jgi:hypothetical protein
MEKRTLLGDARKKRDAQFHQIFEQGSNSQHFNCASQGSCNVEGTQQIIGGTVSQMNIIFQSP